MNRGEFVRKVIRYLLFGSLAIIAAFTGSRIVTGASCSTCPGKGICAGTTDCSTFLKN